MQLTPRFSTITLHIAFTVFVGVLAGSRALAGWLSKETVQGETPQPASALLDEKPKSSEETSATGHISYVFGYKRLERKWAPAQNQADFGGVDFDIRGAHWPVSVATELSLSYSPAVPRLPGFRGNFGGTYELDLGPRKVWQRWQRIQPFLGGGVSILGGSTTTQIRIPGETIYTQEGHDADLGSWGEAGLYLVNGKHWHTGFRVEYSKGSITLFGQRLNPGGVHFMVLLGRHW